MDEKDYQRQIAKLENHLEGAIHRMFELKRKADVYFRALYWSVFLNLFLLIYLCYKLL